MPQKRMRIFAGPNGSGKSTVHKLLEERNINLGVYVNADDIEKELNENGSSLLLSPFKINPSTNEIQDFLRKSTFSPKMRADLDLWQKVIIESNYLIVNTFIDSYLAADIAEFLRQYLFNNDISFTYETVMSHPGKINFMKEAREKGYKVYLYFVATENSSINVSRVKFRITQNGHFVSTEKIKERYIKSLKNLKEAVSQSDRCYLFDNSGRIAYLVATILNGNEVYPEEVVIPWWVETYLLS